MYFSSWKMQRPEWVLMFLVCTRCIEFLRMFYYRLAYSFLRNDGAAKYSFHFSYNIYYSKENCRNIIWKVNDLYLPAFTVIWSYLEIWTYKYENLVWFSIIFYCRREFMFTDLLQKHLCSLYYIRNVDLSNQTSSSQVV